MSPNISFRPNLYKTPRDEFYYDNCEFSPLVLRTHRGEKQHELNPFRRGTIISVAAEAVIIASENKGQFYTFELGTALVGTQRKLIGDRSMKSSILKAAKKMGIEIEAASYNYNHRRRIAIIAKPPK